MRFCTTKYLRRNKLARRNKFYKYTIEVYYIMYVSKLPKLKFKNESFGEFSELILTAY